MAFEFWMLHSMFAVPAAQRSHAKDAKVQAELVRLCWNLSLVGKFCWGRFLMAWQQSEFLDASTRADIQSVVLYSESDMDSVAGFFRMWRSIGNHWEFKSGWHAEQHQQFVAAWLHKGREIRVYRITSYIKIQRCIWVSMILQIYR